MAAWWMPLASQAVGYGLSKLGGGDKASKAANRAAAAQARLSNAMAEGYTKQMNMDLPYRANLFSALNQRRNRQAPRFMPGRAPVRNPYSNVMKYRRPSMPDDTTGQRQRFNLSNALRQRSVPQQTQQYMGPRNTRSMEDPRRNFSGFTATGNPGVTGIAGSQGDDANIAGIRNDLNLFRNLATSKGTEESPNPFEGKSLQEVLNMLKVRVPTGILGT
jgi:hypothetical protein